MTIASAVRLVPVADLKPDPRNPRAQVGDVSELAASIGEHGILQPLRAQENLDLIFGHRRLAAAVLAGLKEVPVIVEDVPPERLVEIQLVENVQRVDLHPMEEAEGYARLMKEHAYSVEDIAAGVGMNREDGAKKAKGKKGPAPRSRSHIYARLKLLELGAAGRKAFKLDELTPSTALLVARVPTESGLQDMALSDVLGGPGRFNPLSYREAVDLIREKYTLELRGAPFDAKDANLVEGRPACTDCPLRTGTNPGLYEDLGKDNLCTGPECYGLKRAAALKNARTKARKGGHKFLNAAEAKRVFARWGMAHGTEYVDLGAEIEEKKKAGQRVTWGGLLKGVPGVPVAQCPDATGKIHRLAKGEDIRAALKTAGELERIKGLRLPGGTSRAMTAAAKPEDPATVEKRVVEALAVDRASRACLAALVHGADIVRPQARSLLTVEACYQMIVARDGYGDVSYEVFEAWRARVNLPPVPFWGALPASAPVKKLRAWIRERGSERLLLELVLLSALPDPDTHGAPKLSGAWAEWSLASLVELDPGALLTSARKEIKAERAKARAEVDAEEKGIKDAEKPKAKKAGKPKAKKAKAPKPAPEVAEEQETGGPSAGAPAPAGDPLPISDSAPAPDGEAVG